MDWKLIVESGASIRHILASHGSTKTGKQTTMRKLTNLLTNWWNKRERISRLILNGLNSMVHIENEANNARHYFAKSSSAWSNQGLVMCLLSILNQMRLYGGNIYLSIYLIIQLEI